LGASARNSWWTWPAERFSCEAWSFSRTGTTSSRSCSASARRTRNSSASNGALTFFNVKTFFGGAERFDTITKGLDLVKDDIDLVAVHDACRCCATESLVGAVIAKASETGAAIPACPVVATIKEVKDDTIVRTVDRANLYEAQTPQVFETALIKKAYENLEKIDKSRVSDDAFLVESLGHAVSIVETDSSNIKITRQSDVAIAEAIIKSRPKPRPEGPIGPYIEAQW
jgi:2-C-methyl-D-erythritol 4-phosphate cytidylyltransferase